MGPAVPGLAMDLPVLLGNVLGIENAVLLSERIAFGEIVTDEGRIDGPVDDRTAFYPVYPLLMRAVHAVTIAPLGLDDWTLAGRADAAEMIAS